MVVKEDTDWVVAALCANEPPDALFAKGAEQRKIRSMCYSCPVRLECLTDALNTKQDFGVWGGLTERERRAMLKHYPQVEDWEDWIKQSQEEIAIQIRSNRAPSVLATIRRDN